MMIDVRNLSDYLRKGECFAITTYCNTIEKVNVLDRTINNIKQFGLPIFIHAHYPLPDEIQKKVHSYYYSSENPILSRYNCFWYFVEKYKLEIKVFDYYYTTLRGWSESINILSEYDRIHMINYDTNVTPELFNLSKKYPKSIFLQNPSTERPYISPTYFCLNKESYKYFIENITLRKYLAFGSYNQELFIPLIEEFIPSFTMGNEFYHVPHTEYNIEKLLEYDIASDTRFDWNKSLSLNGTKIFIGDVNDIAHILFFDITKEIKFNVCTFRKSSHVSSGSFMGGEMGGNISQTTLLRLDIPLNQIEKLIVNINNEVVDETLINKFIQLESRIYLDR